MTVIAALHPSSNPSLNPRHAYSKVQVTLPPGPIKVGPERVHRQYPYSMTKRYRSTSLVLLHLDWCRGSLVVNTSTIRNLYLEISCDYMVWITVPIPTPLYCKSQVQRVALQRDWLQVWILLPVCGYRVTFYKQPTIQYNEKRAHKRYINVFQTGAGFGKENNSKKWAKRLTTYNSRYSLVVTHLTTNPPVRCLNRAERTGSLVFNVLWSYVEKNFEHIQYNVNVCTALTVVRFTG